MSTAARQAEADQVELLYYWALNQLGDAMTVDSLELWSQVPASKQAAKSSWWLVELMRLLFGFRSEAQELALSYYRLTRALRTGYTVETSSSPVGSDVSLDVLRGDFTAIVDEIVRETQGSGVPDNSRPDYRPGVNAPVEVEHVVDVDGLIGELNEASDREASKVLDDLGIETLIRKLEEHAKREDGVSRAHDEAGRRQAGAATRLTLNGGRGLVGDLARVDRRVIGYARYSTTGTPCDWCAMLLSRGYAYGAAKAGARKGRDALQRAADKAEISVDELAKDPEKVKYHDYCKCDCIPVYSDEQYQSNEKFDLNRMFNDMWESEKERLDQDALSLDDWRVMYRKWKKLQTLAA